MVKIVTEVGPLPNITGLEILDGYSGFMKYVYITFLYLFNKAHNTFYLHLYGFGHLVKDHSDNESKPIAITLSAMFTS